MKNTEENEEIWKKRKWRKLKKMKKNQKMTKMKKWKKKEKMKKTKENEEKSKNDKNEKMKEKWRKMAKSLKISSLHTQNPRRFSWFCLGMCLFPQENQQPVLGLTVFPKKSDNFHWTWNKNTHFTDENQRKKIAKVSPSNNNYSFRII